MLVLIRHRMEKRGLQVRPDISDSFIGLFRVSVVTLRVPQKLPHGIALRQIEAILGELCEDASLTFCLSQSFANSGLCDFKLPAPELSHITSVKAAELALLSPNKKNCVMLSSGAFAKDERHALNILLTRFRYFELDMPDESFEAAQDILTQYGISARRCPNRSNADAALIFRGGSELELSPECVIINASGRSGKSSLVSYAFSYPDFFKSSVTEDFRIDEIIAYALGAGVIDEKDIVVSDAKFCCEFPQ